MSRHVVPHEPALRAWLSSRVPPGVEVDDVIQETYTRLIQVGNVDAIQNVKAYMFQAAWSVVMTHVRRKKVVTIQGLADFDQFETGAPSPEQEAADRDELFRLAEAIAALPDRVGEVFRLRRIHGLSQKGVAERMGMPESTVEKYMRKGLLILLDHFQRGGYPPSDASKQTKQSKSPTYGTRDRKRD